MNIVWTEIWVNDLEESFDFYAKLFGWSFDQFTEYDDDYYIARTENTEPPNVAIVKRTQSVVADGKTTVPYFKVPIIEDQLHRIGIQDLAITELPNSTGRFCMLQDPSGNWIGLWDSQATQKRS